MWRISRREVRISAKLIALQQIDAWIYDQSVLGREKNANRPDLPPYPHPAGRRRADGGEHGCGHGGAVAIGGDAAHPGAGGSGNDRGLCRPARRARSEEHTSELQSLMRISYAVFCLKKKKKQITTKIKLTLRKTKK